MNLVRVSQKNACQNRNDSDYNHGYGDDTNMSFHNNPVFINHELHESNYLP